MRRTAATVFSKGKTEKDSGHTNSGRRAMFVPKITSFIRVCVDQIAIAEVKWRKAVLYPQDAGNFIFSEQKLLYCAADSLKFYLILLPWFIVCVFMLCTEWSKAIIHLFNTGEIWLSLILCVFNTHDIKR